MPTQEAVRPRRGELRVYEPHRAGLPKFGPYFSDLRHRLPFAAEFSRSGIRAAHTHTVFGQLWLVLNPLLMALVYYLLVAIISNSGGGVDRLAHIVCGLFVFQLVAGGLQQTAFQVGGVLGTSVLGTILSTRVGHVLVDRLTGAGVPAPAAHRLLVAEDYVAQGVAPVPAGTPGPVAHAITTGCHLAFMDGFQTSMTVAAIVALVAATSALLVRRGRSPVDGPAVI